MKATSGDAPFEGDGGPFDRTVQHAFEGGAPIEQLAEEILRAALELDDPYIDGARRRRIAHAIADSLTADEPPGRIRAWAERRLHGWVVAATVVVLLAAGLVGGYAWAGRGDPAGAPGRADDRGMTVPALLTSAYEHQLAGRTVQAAGAYRAVLALDPANKVAAYNLGLMSQQAGRHEEAERHYRAALRTDAGMPPALFNLAILRTEAGALPEAIDLYRRLVAADPGHAPAYLNLGVALQRSGDREASALAFQRAIEIDPSLASRIAPDSLRAR